MNFIKKIVQTDLFKISSLNSFSVALKIATGFVTSKLLAVFVGPSGLALLGNFRNFVGSFESLSTLGFQNGIVKYIAETKEQETELKKYVSTIFISVATVSLVLSVFLFLFSGYCNEIVFGLNFNYGFVFKSFAFALPWYALSLVLISIINGLGKFKTGIYVAIIGSCIGLLVSVLFIYYFQIVGAMLSIIVTPSLLFLVSCYYVNKKIPLLDYIHIRFFDFEVIKDLFHYFLMALVSGLVSSVVYLEIRKNIISQIGIQEAGYWEALSRISIYYLLFVSSILTLYFLPKLATAKETSETKKIFYSFYKTLFPIFILALIGIYFSRFFIIKILFTKEFLPVSSLFFWQLVSDAFKVASLILGYQFFAKKLTMAFIISELFSFGVLYFSSLYFIKLYGIEGVVMAQAFDYFIYFVVLVVYFRKSLF